MKMHRTTALVLALLVAVSVAGAAPGPSGDISKSFQSFSYLGCSGDWKDYESTAPSIWRLTSHDKVTYLVRHADSCGLEGRNPRVSMSGETLDLGYELYSRDDVAIMCLCEYWASFTFGNDALMQSKVTFNGAHAAQRGDWPAGR